MIFTIELVHTTVPTPKGPQPALATNVHFDPKVPPNLALALVGLDQAKGVVMQMILQESTPRVLAVGNG